MSEGAPVLYSVVDGVGHLELNRPKAFNALTTELAMDLTSAVHAADADDEVKVVMLSGRGRAFSAGGDVKMMAEAADPQSAVRELAEAAHEAIIALTDLRKPVIAGVHGSVAGGGWGLTCAADLVLAGESTKFVAAYAAIAVTPDCGMTWSLPKLVGRRRALEILLLNRPLAAPEAVDYGLVTSIHPDDRVIGEAISMARHLAAGPAADALGGTRRLVHDSSMRSLDEHLAHEARSISESVASPAAQHLISSFVNRRP